MNPGITIKRFACLINNTSTRHQPRIDLIKHNL